MHEEVIYFMAQKTMQITDKSTLDATKSLMETVNTDLKRLRTLLQAVRGVSLTEDYRSKQLLMNR